MNRGYYAPYKGGAICPMIFFFLKQAPASFGGIFIASLAYITRIGSAGTLITSLYRMLKLPIPPFRLSESNGVLRNFSD